MKKLLFIGLLITSLQSLFGQTDRLGSWMVNLDFGMEEHDKRLFNYARPEREALLRKQPELWGTYHLGLGVKRKVWQNKRFSSFIGLGIGYENATFIRPFDHFFFEYPSNKILLALNSYKKVFTPLSLIAFYEFKNHWLISGEMTSNFLLFRSIDHTESPREVYPFSKGTFELDDIQLRLGVNYKFGNWIIGIHSRVFNFQKIDRIIFNHIIKDPRTEQKWEWYNPLRFDLTVGYIW